MVETLLYAGGIGSITYRYHIKKTGNVYYVTISRIVKGSETPVGAKVLMNVAMENVVDECLSHYRRNARPPLWMRYRFRPLGLFR
ncbi:hypothetical protein [[Enterobacter] lignolyticus]|uniref:Uncharacterized protein n=1 Tax=[Enterobacter] lignolyticus TaxID=1334193 RepID=A0A806XBU3_9ENTR|nr:hypothetical protein [[Enterobacter] lignolyticus]ALR76417.1 hypothetical protein AO703_08950 [[Enterobacter] lignolyticus]